jgi:cyclin H
MKRFYLSNSPMDYHPKQMMPSALFLATKTDNHYMSLRKFASKLPNTSEQDIIKPEFLLTQGLRFTFDVRHPQRGLEGGFMELMAVATAAYELEGGSIKTPRQWQSELFELEYPDPTKAPARTVDAAKRRVQSAHDRAKEILKTCALLSDAYFLYTPSQIWLSALMIADEPLGLFYLQAHSASSEPESRILRALRDCAALLRSSPTGQPGREEMQELKRIDKKLQKCRNPEKIDLDGASKSQKRDSGPMEEAQIEKAVKKRRVEQERAGTADDVFGPAI